MEQNSAKKIDMAETCAELFGKLYTDMDFELAGISMFRGLPSVHVTMKTLNEVYKLLGIKEPLKVESFDGECYQYSFTHNSIRWFGLDISIDENNEERV